MSPEGGLGGVGRRAGGVENWLVGVAGAGVGKVGVELGSGRLVIEAWLIRQASPTSKKITTKERIVFVLSWLIGLPVRE